MTAIAVRKSHPVDFIIVSAIWGLALVASIIEIVRSPDPLMVIQAWTFAACIVSAGA